jgi:hypothetical protein
MKNLFLSLAALSALAATPALAANQLVNGSFESGLSGWTTGGGSGDGYPPAVIDYNSSAGYPTGAFGEPVPVDNAALNPGFDAAGGHALYFVADLAHPQTLSQTVSTIAGVSYTFGFDVYLPQNGANNVNDATLSATVGGLTFASFSAGSTPATQWFHFSSAATAVSSGPSTFEFAYNSFGIPAKDFVVDRVYFAPTSEIRVPEPATWAMMLMGFGGLGAVIRRRRNAPALAATA